MSSSTWTRPDCSDGLGTHTWGAAKQQSALNHAVTVGAWLKLGECRYACMVCGSGREMYLKPSEMQCCAHRCYLLSFGPLAAVLPLPAPYAVTSAMHRAHSTVTAVLCRECRRAKPGQAYCYLPQATACLQSLRTCPAPHCTRPCLCSLQGNPGWAGSDPGSAVEARGPRGAVRGVGARCLRDACFSCCVLWCGTSASDYAAL